MLFQKKYLSNDVVKRPRRKDDVFCNEEKFSTYSMTNVIGFIDVQKSNLRKSSIFNMNMTKF